MSDQDHDLYSVAAEWHDRMAESSVTAADEARFAQWLSADPRHASAYRAMERMWSGMGEIGTEARILEFRREALGAVRERPVWTRRVAAAAAALVLMVGAAILANSWLNEPGVPRGKLIAGQKLDAGVFTTAVGERSTLTLSDGSSVVLDTQSRIDVAYSPDQRLVRLVSGQAWFQVAKNPQRPFVVDAGDRRITALGTAFDVRLLGSEKSVQVTLVEGRVTVEAIQSPWARLLRSPPAPSVLTPGDSLVIADAQPVITRRADVAKIGSWRQGQIVFSDETLASAIEEVNRYSHVQIVLADPSLAGLRVSGVFNAGHSQSFIETVTGHYPIVASHEGDGRVVLAPKSSASGGSSY
jgi:transmembrane sensor